MSGVKAKGLRFTGFCPGFVRVLSFKGLRVSGRVLCCVEFLIFSQFAKFAV